METNERLRFWLALRSIEGVGDVTARSVARRFGGPHAVFGAGTAGLAAAGLERDLARAIARFRDWDAVDREIGRAERAGARILCLDDPGYPTALRHIFDPPVVLYVLGDLRPEDVQAIAIVGSRRASPYGLAAAGLLARDLAAAGVTVVSGLAIGIDAAAHRGALGAGGRTLAVLGSGLDRIYPERHAGLAREIAESGALISEFPFGTEPERFNFPRRNRVVAGLSLAVVVVEAGEHSGSLITARLAAEQGRDVFAVPGEINLPRTRGTHRLLRDGAALAERGEDVIAGALPWLLATGAENRQTVRFAAGPSPDGARLLGCFDGSVIHVDQLIERSRLGAARVLEILLDLELKGLVSPLPGMFFSRRVP